MCAGDNNTLDRLNEIQLHTQSVLATEAVYLLNMTSMMI